jgi:uncharacterized protein YwgA
MSKLYEYEQELVDIIRSYELSIEEDRMIFEEYGPLVKALNQEAYNMFERGYQDSVNWGQHGVLMANEALSELHRQMVNRAEGARKAAATRKANKEKVS